MSMTGALRGRTTRGGGRRKKVLREEALPWAAACLLAALLALLAWVGAGVPAAVAPMPAGPVGGTTLALLLLAMPLVAAWGARLCARCSDAFVRRRLVGVTALLAVWLLTATAKYSLHWEPFELACWYFYYVPVLFLPVLCVGCAAHVARLDRGCLRHLLHGWLPAVSALLAVLVLTNSWHGRVFVLELGDGRWTGGYSYGWAYLLVFGWCLALYLTYFGLLFYVAHQRLRRLFAPALAVGAAAALYCLAYALGARWFWASNFTLFFVGLFVLGMELSFRLGLMPATSLYREAFEDLPLNARVFAEDGTCRYQARRAEPLTAQEGEALRRFLDGSATGALTEPLPGTRVHQWLRVPGGVAMLVEDREAVTQKRRALDERARLLRARNQLLRRDVQVRGRLYRAEQERLLLDQVDAGLAAAMEAVQGLLAGLEPLDKDAGEKGARDAGPGAQLRRDAREERRRTLMLVRLLVGYCKRKGAFVLEGAGDADFDDERVNLVLHEAASEARACGVDCAVLAQGVGALPATVAGALYDCVYDLVTLAFLRRGATLLLALSARDDGTLALGATLEWDARNAEEVEEAFREINEVLAERPVRYRVLQDDDGLLVNVEFERPRRTP